MNAQLTEIMRLITNLIRTGVVTEVDRENWLCRVKTGELETNWINWLTLRAGNARTWWRPSEGEQVVLLSLGGNLETAFALPAVYSNQFAPPSTSADACVTEHPDGGWFEYEPATGRWYVRGIKSMVIEAADNITMKTSEFVLEADRTCINSEVVINGGVSWRSTGTAATRVCFIGQRSGFTYCAVVVFAPHGITDGECPENCSRCAGCTVAVWIIRFTCYCCDVYESTGSTTRWTGCRRRGAASTGIRSAGDAARCPVCHIWSVRCSAQSDRSCGYCTGGRGAGCLEILATHHRISRWCGGRIQSGGRSRQCRIRTA